MTCGDCLWYGNCLDEDPGEDCSYFTPYLDEHTEHAIECGRNQFRQEWFQYIYDWDKC